MGWRHIPDVRARASRLFLALNKRGDFKIWSDEFEELCDVIAKEVERQPDIARLKRRRSNADLHFVKHPFYNYVVWALTLSSLSIAIAAVNVRYQDSLTISSSLDLEGVFLCLIFLMLNLSFAPYSYYLFEYYQRYYWYSHHLSIIFVQFLEITLGCESIRNVWFTSGAMLQGRIGSNVWHVPSGMC